MYSKRELNHKITISVYSVHADESERIGRPNHESSLKKVLKKSSECKSYAKRGKFEVRIHNHKKRYDIVEFEVKSRAKCQLNTQHTR